MRNMWLARRPAHAVAYPASHRLRDDVDSEMGLDPVLEVRPPVLSVIVGGR
jgi:hypothetical protein